MIAKTCMMSAGMGKSEKGLPSFDRALLDAGVGNYNLVRLSSILPAKCVWTDAADIEELLTPGSLLPTAYSTISSHKVGDVLVSTIGVGLPVDDSKVGVIMEYSAKNVTEEDALETLDEMIREAFEVRGWELKCIFHTSVSMPVTDESEHTTFACIAEW